MMRNLGGAIGIAVCGTLLNDRTNLHFLRLAEHLNATNVSMQEMLQRVSARFAAANGGDSVHGHAVALKQLWAVTYREAQVQTVADAFILIGICCVVAALTAPFMRKISAPPSPTAAANAH
jgi:DHA2 family multidrug resistance protein